MAHYRALNDIYLKHLCRPIDLDGYNTYSSILENKELTIREIEDIIENCSEASMRDHRVERKNRVMSNVHKTLAEFVPPDPGIIDEHFHVVVSRYNEDASWLKQLVYYNCSVFLYNKGNPLAESMPPNVTVLDVANVGYEDYVYACHISRYYEYYQYNNTKIVFAQCGIDHCPNILDALKHVPAYNKYHSFVRSIGVSEAWGSSGGTGVSAFSRDMIPVARNMYDVGGGSEYVDAFVKCAGIAGEPCVASQGVDLYKHYCDYFDVPPLRKPVFSPCAVFVVPSCKVTKHDVSVYERIMRHVEHIHDTSNPIMAKVFASVMERLWYTLFI